MVQTEGLASSAAPELRDLDGPRSARPEEIPAILEALEFVFRTSRGRPASIATDWPHIYNAENAANVIIVRCAERVICSTGIWPNEIQLGDARLKVGGINCVFTLPEYRKHGLGGAMMNAAHDRMRRLGCQVGLLGTLIANWYRRLGWERAGCGLSYQLNRSNVVLLPRRPQDVEVQPAGAGEPGGGEALGEVLRLRAADRLGGIRSHETLLRLLEARGNPRLVLARRGGEAIAYLLARDRSISEWGGAAEAVGGLVRAWFETCDQADLSTSTRDVNFRPLLQDEMTLTAPCWGHPFLEVLEQLRFPFTIGYHGMFCLLEPQAVLEAFKLDDVSIRQEGDSFTLSCGDEQCTLDRRQLAKLFFGPEQVCGFAPDLFPLPFWQWGLEHV